MSAEQIKAMLLREFQEYNADLPCAYVQYTGKGPAKDDMATRLFTPEEISETFLAAKKHDESRKK